MPVVWCSPLWCMSPLVHVPFAESLSKVSMFLISADANWLRVIDSPLIRGISIVFSNTSSRRRRITFGLLNGAWTEYGLSNGVGAESPAPTGLVASCGPLVGRGGGVAPVWLLNPGGGSPVWDLVRLLVLVEHICTGDPRSTYGWRLNPGLMPGCCSYAAGDIP